MTRRGRVALLAVFVAAAFFAYEFTDRVIAYTDDAYVRADLIAVAPEVDGRIVKLHVTDGQTVAAGALLMTIDPVPFELELDERRARDAVQRFGPPDSVLPGVDRFAAMLGGLGILWLLSVGLLSVGML